MPTQCKSRKQLAAEYGVSPKTLMRMLKRHGVVPPLGLLPPGWVERIYKLLGQPDLLPPNGLRRR